MNKSLSILQFLLLRRRKGKKSRKDRKKENSMGEFDTNYQNVWKMNREDASDYDEDDSSSSYHRDTSTNYQLNNGMK